LAVVFRFLFNNRTQLLIVVCAFFAACTAGQFPNFLEMNQCTTSFTDRELTQEKINNIISIHQHWLADKDAIYLQSHLLDPPKNDDGRANLCNMNLTNLQIQNTSLRGAYLLGTSFHNTPISGVDLSFANMRYGSLDSSNVVSTVINNAQLGNLTLTNLTLSNDDLSNSDLTNMSLTRVILDKVNLSNSILLGVDLTGIDVAGITDDALAKVNLYGARGLDELSITNLIPVFKLYKNAKDLGLGPQARQLYAAMRKKEIIEENLFYYLLLKYVLGGWLTSFGGSPEKAVEYFVYSIFSFSIMYFWIWKFIPQSLRSSIFVSWSGRNLSGHPGVTIVKPLAIFRLSNFRLLACAIYLSLQSSLSIAWNKVELRTVGQMLQRREYTFIPQNRVRALCGIQFVLACTA
jgi:uncharacterized protein YjbI with pentapeptide repeats